MQYCLFASLVGRWSQDTGSDNEVHSHKTHSPNPLPNPDITDTTYLHHNKKNMPPSILENIQSNYNLRTDDRHKDSYDNDRCYKYEVDRDSLYGRKKDFQDNYRDYDTSCHMKPNQTQTPNHYDSGGSVLDMNSQLNHQIRGYPPHHEHAYPLYDKHRISYMASGNAPSAESPYRSKERIPPELYSPRDNHYLLSPASGSMYDPMGSTNGVHMMLKNDFQVLFN